MNPKRQGMALPVVVSVIFVVVSLVLSFFRYQQSRIFVTGAAVNDLSALAAAEAGISCVLSEIERSRYFATHEIPSVDPSGEPVWGDPIDRRQLLGNEGLLNVVPKTNGTYEGQIGDGNYTSSFKVRVGYMPLIGASGATTPGLASKYLYVEALGFRQDPTGKKDRSTRIRLMVERIQFSEFLLYDGEFLTIGMGSYENPDQVNIFADGRLYGEQWVHLGHLKNNGTKQLFYHLTEIRSAGNILAQSNFNGEFALNFQASPSASGASSADAGFSVDFSSSNDSSSGALVDAKGRILDGANKGNIDPVEFDFEGYKERLTGTLVDLDMTRTDVKTDTWHSYPYFDTMEYKVLDFGKARYTGAGDDGDPKGLNTPYPTDFNGVIISKYPLMVYGSPDRDVTVVSDGHIFVSGDFNVRGNHRQDYRPRFVSELNEDGDEISKDSPYYTYEHPEKFMDEYEERVPPDQADRMSCALITFGNFWRDTRLPGRAFKNELVALLAWDLSFPLLRAAGVDPTTPGFFNRRLEFVTADPSALNLSIPLSSAPSPDAPTPPSGVPPLLAPLDLYMEELFPGDVPDSADPQAHLRTLPQSYEGSSISSKNLSQFLAMPPIDARLEMPGYLLENWYLTIPSKTKFNQMVNDRLQAAGGQITYELLWGPNGDDGLLHDLYDIFLEDEPHYSEYQGLPFLGSGDMTTNRSPHTSRLALANAPQRLYNLVRDELEADPMDNILFQGMSSSGAAYGPFSDQSGKLPKTHPNKNDRFYTPQLTVNALVLSRGKTNDSDFPGGDFSAAAIDKLKDANSIDRRFHELGNPRANGLHYLTTIHRRNGKDSIKHPYIQRIRGSVIRYGDFPEDGPAKEPQMRSGFYWPPIRRRIYDPGLVVHPPPALPATSRIRSWHNLGATPEDFSSF